jgi:uncharacterized protein (TIGR02246 family)
LIKFVLLPVMLAALSPFSAGQEPAASKREGAIRRLVADFSTARNASDLTALSKVYADDAEYIPFGQSPIIGQRAIVRAWSALPDWNSRAERTVRSIRFIKPDVAVVQMDVHFSGRATLDFNDTLVVARKARHWRIVLQETVLPPNEYQTVLSAQSSAK